jgi:hypothetical protein
MAQVQACFTEDDRIWFLSQQIHLDGDATSCQWHLVGIFSYLLVPIRFTLSTTRFSLYTLSYNMNNFLASPHFNFPSVDLVPIGNK